MVRTAIFVIMTALALSAASLSSAQPAFGVPHQPRRHRCRTASPLMASRPHRPQRARPQPDRLSHPRLHFVPKPRRRKRRPLGLRQSLVRSVHTHRLRRQSARIGRAGLLEGHGLGPGWPALGLEPARALVHGTPQARGLESAMDRPRRARLLQGPRQPLLASGESEVDLVSRGRRGELIPHQLFNSRKPHGEESHLRDGRRQPVRAHPQRNSRRSGQKRRDARPLLYHRTHPPR